jgi:hypothetical protein
MRRAIGAAVRKARTKYYNTPELENGSTIVKSRSLTIAGENYDLGHLDSFQFEFVVPEKDGRPSQSYMIEVWFSIHCFSRGIADGEQVDVAQICRDGSEKRIFDRERYELSKQLAEIIRNIGSRKCFHTGKGNFFTIEYQDANGKRAEYSIYFRVERRQGSRRLVLKVESAYVNDKIPRSRRHPPAPISFSVIAHHISVGKKIKSPQR